MTIANNKTVKTGSLQLDPRNSRIPAERRTDEQRELLHELLENEDIKSLASSIAKMGLFPNERLVVIKAQGPFFTVLEGNRRLAAIRLLLNPELAPRKTTVAYFRKLSSAADISALEAVDVAVVEDRLAAAPIIATLHTGDSKRRWSSVQQARFYRELVDEGLTPGEVADTVGLALSAIRSHLRTEKLLRIAQTLDYDEATRQKVKDSRFPLTTLERFLDSRVGRKFLGIDFVDDQSGFRGIVHPDRFHAVLKRIVDDIADKRITTRDINRDSDIQAYIEEADNRIEKTRKRGSFDPDVLLTGRDLETSGPAGNADGADRAGSRPPRASSSVVPRGFRCTSSNLRIRQVFKELKNMKIKEQINSTGVMLRVLIDIALWHYLVENGHHEDAVDHYDKSKKRRKNNSGWTPNLRDLISYAVDRELFEGMPQDAYRSVRSLASKDADYFITINGFNAFTHNLHVTPTENDLRALWHRAEPMLRIILK